MSNKKAGFLGLFAVLLFTASLLIFGNLNTGFSFLHDFVSKLGAKGEPYALWWNLFGFVWVGLALFGFGIAYGKILGDKLAGLLLSLFGVGFTFTAIPMDMVEADTAVSKAHIVAICLALACWLFGLARISSNHRIAKSTRCRANVTAILIVLSMTGFALGLWPMPLTHRLVFLVVFGWTAITACELIQNKHIPPPSRSS